MLISVDFRKSMHGSAMGSRTKVGRLIQGTRVLVVSHAASMSKYPLMENMNGYPCVHAPMFFQFFKWIFRNLDIGWTFRG